VKKVLSNFAAIFIGKIAGETPVRRKEFEKMEIRTGSVIFYCARRHARMQAGFRKECTSPSGSKSIQAWANKKEDFPLSCLPMPFLLRSCALS